MESNSEMTVTRETTFLILFFVFIVIPYQNILRGCLVGNLCFISLILSRLSEFSRLAGEVFLNHKSNLECYRVVKLSEVKSGKLSDLFKSVYESITVNEELS